MGLLDKFLDAVKLNDDYDEEDDFDEEDDDFDDDFEEEKPRKRFFSKFREEDEDFEEEDAEEERESRSRTGKKELNRERERNQNGEREKTRAKAEKHAARSFDTDAEPARESRPQKERTKTRRQKTQPRKKNLPSMEVNVVRPTSMEDTKEIADTLIEACTVVLNLEGLDVDTAQRIIDFTCGACYALNGSLQKISNYIFILTPADVDISGDYQSILNGAFDLPSMSSQY